MLAQIARGFGIHEMTLDTWLLKADIENGARSGVTVSELAGLGDLWRRNGLLEQVNEVLRRAAGYLSQANLPGK
ncbi:hypothetical protein KEM60_00181 [Austwickia sp. TVS 96-490-7B]|uniref:hypothetical protein n=1 Tax=Austwickia sp. TVS 96-490-7B TaxID=2830843 RepID=UPI001C59863E|nr:hypothetical protein [Austwickia sp. TVS 96-490-7B]MBW3083998.1 hypothetical protein [Austwickia sp. TVS 96-490-7B]